MAQERNLWADEGNPTLHVRLDSDVCQNGACAMAKLKFTLQLLFQSTLENIHGWPYELGLRSGTLKVRLARLDACELSPQKSIPTNVPKRYKSIQKGGLKVGGTVPAFEVGSDVEVEQMSQTDQITTNLSQRCVQWSFFRADRGDVLRGSPEEEISFHAKPGKQKGTACHCKVDFLTTKHDWHARFRDRERFPRLIRIFLEMRAHGEKTRRLARLQDDFLLDGEWTCPKGC